MVNKRDINKQQYHWKVEIKQDVNLFNMLKVNVYFEKEVDLIKALSVSNGNLPVARH